MTGSWLNPNQRGGLKLCQFIVREITRTHGIGARIVPSGQNQIIKKYKENLLLVSFVISAQQKLKGGIAQNRKLILL
jgi:hypothetical protein